MYSIILNISKYPLILCCFMLLLFSTESGIASDDLSASERSLQPVTLQLKWKHQFQFAGYYAALEKGFYKKAGLDVRILEIKDGEDSTDKVIEGKADFGIAMSDLILHRAKGQPVVALAAIFQHSPLIILTPKSSGIENIHALKEKRLGMEAHSAELIAYMENEGISLEEFEIVPHDYSVSSLILRQVDGISAYSTDEPFILLDQGIEYSTFTPRAGGIDFYGDTLFTSETQIREHPERVASFLAATLKGWDYALENSEEIVDLILSKYTQRHSREHLLFEAHHSKSLIMADVVQLGYMHIGRWSHIAQTYAKLGMVDESISLDGFLYSPDSVADYGWLKRIIGTLVIICLLLGLGALILVLLNRKFAFEVNERKQSEKINNVLFSISNAVNISNDLDDLYRKIHHFVGEIIDVTNFFIAAVNERKKTLYFPYYVDSVDKDFSPITNFDPENSLTGFVVTNRKPLLIKEKQLQLLAKKNGIWGPVPLVWMGVPLVVKNEIIGVMAVQSYTDSHLYDERDLEVLVSISDQMAIAIDRKGTENELIKSEKKYRELFDLAQEGIWVIDKDHNTTLANPSMAKMLGYTPEEMTGKNLFYFMDEAAKEIAHAKLERRQKGIVEQHDFEFLKKDGQRIFTTVETAPLLDEDGNYGGAIAGVLDITKRRQAEEEKINLQTQLQHSQNMESVGTLAGGIAHDFNNILSAVIGFTELALDAVEKETPIEEDLQEVYTAGLRAKDLVQQILTFARQSDEELKPIRVDNIIKEVLKFIRSSIPTTIEIKQNIASTSFIMGNITQVHRVMMNLCTNAAHAMEDEGGTLEVSLKDISIDRATMRRNSHIKPGNYIEIKVSDTGAGIDPQITNKIFEPYFTTKGPGEGTGMGLAMVHGIVETYRGKIFVDSTLGQGTLLTINLPVARESKAHQKYKVEVLPTGQERILYVDDEPQIAKIASRILSQLGYTVTTKTNSEEALEIFRSKPNDYDLVISDMTMPKITGDQLAQKLIQIRPNIPVILCTGYSKRLSEENASEIGIKAFAYKPIVKEDLAKTVRDVLDLAKC